MIDGVGIPQFFLKSILNSKNMNSVIFDRDRDALSYLNLIKVRTEKIPPKEVSAEAQQTLPKDEGSEIVTVEFHFA